MQYNMFAQVISFTAMVLTLFDVGFFEPSALGYGTGGGGGRHDGSSLHNFLFIAPMIIKFGAGIKLDVRYIMVRKIVT